MTAILDLGARTATVLWPQVSGDPFKSDGFIQKIDDQEIGWIGPGNARGESDTYTLNRYTGNVVWVRFFTNVTQGTKQPNLICQKSQKQF
jgi:hypothetical protein